MDSRSRQLRRGVLDTFVLRCLALALALAINSLLAKLISPADFGVVRYVLNLVGFLIMLTVLGLPQAGQRYLSEYQTKEQWDFFRGFLKRSQQLATYASLLVAAILLLASFWPAVPPDKVLTLRFVAGLLPMATLLLLRRGVLIALSRVRYSMLFDDLLLGLLVIAGLWLMRPGGALPVLWIYLLANFVVLLVSSWVMTRSLPAAALSGPLKFDDANWRRSAGTLVVGMVFMSFTNRADILLLGAMVPMATLGIYAGASQLASLTTVILTATAAVVTPLLAQAYHKGDRAHFRQVRSQSIGIITLVTLPVYLVMVIWPEVLLTLVYSEEFVDGAIYLRLLATGQLVNAVTGPMAVILNVSGREHQLTFTRIASAVLATGLGYFLIRHYGAVGAAISTAICISLVNLWLFWLTREAAIWDQPA